MQPQTTSPDTDALLLTVLQEAEGMIRTQTEAMIVCAWCEPNNHTGSHGICAKHAAEVLQQHRDRRVAHRQQLHRSGQQQKEIKAS
jgi:hypothetical protein